MVWASGAGGGVFSFKLTRNPNLKFFFVLGVCVWGGGGGGGGKSKCTCMNKCFKWHFYSSRRTLCKIILKAIYTCRSYGQEKLIYVTFKCDLDRQPT